MQMRKIILGVMLVGVACAVIYAVDRNHKYHAGYCFARHRYIGEYELGDMVIEEMLEQLQVLNAKSGIEEQANYYEYKGLEDFYNKNPYPFIVPIRKDRDPDYFKKLKKTHNAMYVTYGRHYYTSASFLRLRNGQDYYGSASYTVYPCGRIAGSVRPGLHSNLSEAYKPDTPRGRKYLDRRFQNRSKKALEEYLQYRLDVGKTYQEQLEKDREKIRKTRSKKT